MAPPVVAPRDPAIAEAVSTRLVVPLLIETLPLLPPAVWVVKLTAPVNALLVLFSVMVLSLTLVTKDRMRAAYGEPVCVMVPPVVALNDPAMVDAARIRLVVPLLIVKLTLVTKLLVPATVKAPV